MSCDATKANGPKCARIVGLESHLKMNCMKKGVIEVLAATAQESLPPYHREKEKLIVYWLLILVLKVSYPHTA